MKLDERTRTLGLTSMRWHRTS